MSVFVATWWFWYYTWIVLAMASTTWGNIDDAWSNGVPTDNCAVKSFWPISIVYKADANVDGKGRTSLNQPRQKHVPN